MAEGSAKLPLPTAIGDKPGEQPAKAVESNQAAMKTPSGIGAALAGAGVSGQTLIAAAQQVQPHIDDTPIGKIIAGGFALLMIGGVGLLVWDFFRKRNEKAS